MVIGVIVGLEGVIALWLPLVVGSWSDRLRTPIGGRLPFLIAATPIVVAGLVAMSLVGSEKLITKIYFPRLCVPFASVGAAVVDFFVSLTLLVAMMLWYGVPPDRGIVLAPFIFFIILLLAVGVSTTLAALNVAYRDFRYVIYDFVATLVALTALALLGRARQPAPVAATLLGVAVSLAGALLQNARIGLHEQFNHNDLFHVVEIAGMFCFYRAGRSFQ